MKRKRSISGLTFALALACATAASAEMFSFTPTVDGTVSENGNGLVDDLIGINTTDTANNIGESGFLTTYGIYEFDISSLAGQNVTSITFEVAQLQVVAEGNNGGDARFELDGYAGNGAVNRFDISPDRESVLPLAPAEQEDNTYRQGTPGVDLGTQIIAEGQVGFNYLVTFEIDPGDLQLALGDDGLLTLRLGVFDELLNESGEGYIGSLMQFTEADGFDFGNLFTGPQIGIGPTLSIEVAAVPLPAAAWLFGSALLGLGLIKRRS